MYFFVNQCTKEQKLGIITREMMQLRWVGAVALGLAVLGCGGNVANQSTNTPVSTGPVIVGDPQIEMVAYGGFIPVAVPTYSDSLNIRTGEQTQFQLVGYTATGQRVILEATDWRLSSTDSNFGVISGNTGVFTAGSRQTPSPQLVSVRFGGREFTTDYQIKPRQARVIGLLVNQSSGLPIKNVVMEFFSTTGTYLGRARTAYDGSFRVSVPTTVGSFQIISDSLPTGNRREIVFDTNQAITLSRPSYFNNLDSTGAVVPITVPGYTSLPVETGINNALVPIGSTNPSFNADYYLGGPVLIPAN